LQISLKELQNIKGIGKKTIERIKKYKLSKEGFVCKYNKKGHLNKNSINNGDCLKLMNGIPDRSVNMILADLPYQQTQNSWDSQIDLNKLWMQYRRIIKDNGSIILFGKKKFTADLILSNSNWYRYSFVWIKSRPSGFLNASKMPLESHEDIVVFYKNLPTYNPQFHEGKPLHGMGHKFKKGDLRNNNYGDFNSHTNPSAKRTGDIKKYPRTDLFFKKPHPPIHPTQKPVKLLEYLIMTYTNEGDLVLDNVSGSGSTAVAALNTKRDYICIEKDKNYYGLSQKRIENLKKTTS